MALPPVEREPQTLDLGESLLTTIQIDSDAIDTLFTDSNSEVTNASVNMVLRQLLNDEFSETLIEVETARVAARNVYLSREEENEPVFFSTQLENNPIYLSRSIEASAAASIIIRIPALLFSSSFNQVNAFVRAKKVAGKTYVIESL